MEKIETDYKRQPWKNLGLTFQDAQTPWITFLYAYEVVSTIAIISFQQNKRLTTASENSFDIYSLLVLVFADFVTSLFINSFCFVLFLFSLSWINVLSLHHISTQILITQ